MFIIGFTIFYHDIIYDVKQNNNEAQSAILAKKRLLELNVPQKIITQVVELILLTKTHNETTNELYKLFLDADLAILGTDKKSYELYSQAIRKEYSSYDTKTYNQGRIKMLQSFINRPKIFQTDFFYIKYEKTAQKNIQNELLQLK